MAPVSIPVMSLRRSNQPARGRHRRASGRPSLVPPRVSRRGAVVAGTVAAAAVLMIDAGLSTGLSGVPGSAMADTTQPSGTVTGTATNYTLTSGSGNCSYASPPSDGLFAALSPAEYADGTACGEYIDVHGPNGTVRVEVTDQCPECSYGHIDLSQGAFSRIAPLSAGQVPVTYDVVSSPPLAAPLSVTVKDGSSPYWLALLPANTGNPLSSVEVQNSAGNWTTLTRSGYGYWLAPQGAGSGPFNVRLTDTHGNQTTLYGVALNPGQTQNTGTWMYGH